MSKRLSIFFLWLGLLLTTPLYADKPEAKINILTSIKPLYLLTTAIAQNKANVELLIPATLSAHGYPLKPSDRKKIAQAQIVLMCDENLETSLKPFLKSQNNFFVLSKRASFHRLEYAKSKTFDPHFWLSPENGKHLAQYIADLLSQQDPKNQAHYLKNAKKLISDIQSADAQIRKSLKNITHKPFIVYHDGFQYFVQYYQLNQADMVLKNHHHHLSLKQLDALSRKIEKEKITCLFKEPQMTSKIIDTLKKNHPLNIDLLDPLGANLKEDTYPGLLLALEKSFTDCLN